MIRQPKTIQISTYNYNLLAESIHSPNFFCQMLKTSKFVKLSPHQTFPLYSNFVVVIIYMSYVPTYNYIHIYIAIYVYHVLLATYVAIDSLFNSFTASQTRS